MQQSLANERTEPMQAGILYECSKQQRQSSLYICQTDITINASVRLHRLKKAIQTIITPLSIVKTAFDCQAAEFTKHIATNPPRIPVIEKDFSKLSTMDKITAFNEYLLADKSKSFDLAVAPLMRFSLIKLNNKHYHLIWTRHHILMDGRSTALVLQAIFQNYCQKPVQQLQEGHITPTTVNKCYWQTILEKHHHASLAPPGDNAAKETQREVISLCSTKSAYHALEQLKLNSGCSFNTLLLAIWSITIAHYSDNPYVSLGAVRSASQSQHAIGLLINTLPIITAAQPEYHLFDFFNSVKKQLQGLKKAVMTPLGAIKESIGLYAEDNIFESIVDYKPIDLEDYLHTQFPELNLQASLSLDTPHTIALVITKKAGYFLINLNYDSGQYSQPYLQSLLTHFLRLINAACRYPQQRIKELPRLSATETLEFKKSWQQSCTKIPQHNHIVTLFEKAVAKSPHKIALLSEKEQLSFEQLNQRANQLAHYLLKQGIVPETLVAIMTTSKIDFIVAIWGVLKAGAAYLPLDNRNPEKRTQYLLKNSDARYLITEAELSHHTPEKVTAIILNQISSNLPQDNPGLILKPNQLAYVIYTSGTTAEPKGVMIESASLVNLCQAQAKLLKLDGKTRALQLASSSFDASVFEIFAPLLESAALCIPAQTICDHPASLLHFIAQHRINIITITPTHLDNLDLKSCKDLRCLVVAGEKLQTKHQQYTKQLTLINAYGPTENTVCASLKVLEADKPISIGKPLPHVQIYILDQQQQVSPLNALGEIYIGGSSLARGYLHDTTTTAQNFVTLTFFGQSARLYRSGDLARRLPNGEIEFISRHGDMVKIKGFRLSLSEIQAALLKHPAVKQAAVLKAAEENTTSISAYVVTQADKPSETELRQFLAKYLPYYMLPQAISFVKQLPYTRHGKLDSQQLLKYYDNQSQQASENSDIMNNTQQLIAATLEGISGRKATAFSDNIFDLGLNSLNLSAFMQQLEQRFSVSLAISDFFIYTRINQIAGYILHKKTDAQTQVVKHSMLPSYKPHFKKRISFPHEPSQLF